MRIEYLRGAHLLQFLQRAVLCDLEYAQGVNPIVFDNGAHMERACIPFVFF